ncbi:MAG: MBL fold metallo-hydrolase [Firmicutes bacterium]|nr:MBL fold metallo-hydrolase [Bacillota bacterium]
MIVRWFGHSCFFFYSKKGTRIITDPYAETVSYPFPPLTCEIVVVSHEHQDHNAVWRIMGEPFLVKRTNPGLCEFEVPLKLTGETFVFKGLPVYHDEALGRKRGPNTIFLWRMDGYSICHLGDLGHPLNEEQVKAIGKVDILLLPVGGGKQVLDGKEATLVVHSLQPSFVFPMHYKTASVDMGLDSVDEFLRLMTQVERLNGNQFEVNTVPKQSTVVVFDYPVKRG